MRLGRAGQDPHIPEILDVSLAPSNAAPARARAAVGAWLRRELCNAILSELALLLVSELVTNSVRHATLPGEEPLRLRASLRTEALRLELWDNGTDGAVTRRRPDQGLCPGGFGLNLVAQLSDTWGVERDGGGTTVWLELPIPDGAAA